MNRDEVSFYFQSLRLLFVLFIGAQVVTTIVIGYLYFIGRRSQFLVELEVEAETMLLLLILPGLLVGLSVFILKTQVVKAVKTWGVDKKMIIYRKALVLNWVLCLFAAAIVAAVFYTTSMVWIGALSVLILVYFSSTFINPIRLAKRLKLTRGELNELQSYYKNISKS